MVVERGPPRLPGSVLSGGGHASASRRGVRENGRFSARALHRTFTFPTHIPAVQDTGSEKQRPRNPR
jgi:hypothetical protein